MELGVCAVIRHLCVGFEVLRGAGAGALGFHFALEAFFVQLNAQFARHVGGEVVGEAVGVVEFEDMFARHNQLAVGDIVFQVALQGFAVSAVGFGFFFGDHVFHIKGETFVQAA